MANTLSLGPEIVGTEFPKSREGFPVPGSMPFSKQSSAQISAEAEMVFDPKAVIEAEKARIPLAVTTKNALQVIGATK